ncbi:MAG TPA: extracellular solute-binding protein [Candidatus Bipolaricaulota bacterium]
MKRRTFLKAAAGALGVAGWCGPTWGAGRRFVFWNALFDSYIYRKEFVPWWDEQIRVVLPPYIESEPSSALPYPTLEQRFLLSAFSGEPDLIEGVLDHVANYQAKGFIEPLTERFQAWEEQDQYVPAMLDALTIQGQLWGLPYIGNGRALVYRKSILGKYGLRVPGTWDELLEAARTITAHEPDVSGYMMTTKKGLIRGFQEFMSHVFQFADRVFAYESGAWEVQLDVEQVTQILGLYRAMFEGDPSPIPKLQQGKAALTMDLEYSLGKVAMMPNGPYIFGWRYLSDFQRQLLETDTGIAPLPIPPQGHAGTYLEVKSVMINGFTDLKSEAWEVARLWSGRESVLRHVSLTGDLPARKDVFEGLKDLVDDATFNWQRQWFSILDDARALDPLPLAGVRDATFDAIQEAVFTAEPVADVAQRLHAQMALQAQNFTAPVA